MGTFKLFFARPVSVMLIGSVAGQGLVLAASPLLTRIYEPEAFGSLAVLTALASVSSVIATLRWEAGIVLPKDDLDSRALAWLGILSTLVFCVAIMTSILLWPGLVDTLAGNGANQTYWWLLPLTVGLIGLHKICSVWMVRSESYSRLGHRNFLQGVGQLLVQLGFGLANVKPLGLLLGLGAGRLAGLGGVVGRGGVFDGGLPPRSRLASVAVRYRRYPLITSWGSFINALGLQAPILILAAGYGAMEFGFVALTIRVLATPVGIVSDAVAQRYEAQVGRILRDGTQTFATLTYKTIIRLSLVAIGPTVLLCLFGNEIFGFVFGNKWEPAGTLAQIMVISYFVQFVTSPISRSLVLLQKQGTQALWDAMRAVSVVGAVLYAIIGGFDLFDAVIFLTAAHVFWYVILIGLTIQQTRLYRGAGVQ